MDEETPPTPEPASPVPGPTPPGPPKRRQLLLGAIVFVATLAVLLGLTGIVGRGPAVGTGTEGPSAALRPTAATSTSPMPSRAAGGTATSSPAGSIVASPPPSLSPTASPSAGDPVLVGAGDIAECTTDADAATARLVEAIPGSVFTAGDNVYEAASAATFRDCYAPTWGRFKDRTRPAAGNHDWADGGIDAYRAYFGAAAGTGDATWYAYDLGTWRVIVLDSDCGQVGGCGPDSTQGRWLANELADHPTACTLAIWHHPRFSSGVHGDANDVAPFWRALYDAGADVVINGHDHDYERFAPQAPDGRADPSRGIREFVVGTGGAELRTFPRAAPNSELRAALYHGVIELTLHDGSYDWRFLSTTTDFSDSGTAHCHP